VIASAATWALLLPAGPEALDSALCCLDVRGYGTSGASSSDDVGDTVRLNDSSPKGCGRERELWIKIKSEK